MMQSEFTDKAEAALACARKCARQLKQGYVGTEHILAGLLKQKTGVAARVLSENGVDEAKLMEMMKELLIADMTVALKEKDDYKAVTDQTKGLDGTMTAVLELECELKSQGRDAKGLYRIDN